jgi:hypothetical protein
MLWLVAIILILLWIIGLLTSFTLGGFIHVLIIVAVILVLVRIIRGRRIFSRSGPQVIKKRKDDAL